jgi:ATP-binding cassette subfamily B protein
MNSRLIRLRHSVPGRERWEVAPLRGRPEVAQGVQESLEDVPGIESVDANPMTGRVLIVYDRGTLTGSVEDLLAAALAPALAPPLAAVPTHLGRYPVMTMVLANSDRGTVASAIFGSIASSAFSVVPPLAVAAMADLVTSGAVTLAAPLWILAAITVIAYGVERLIDGYRRRHWRRLARTVENNTRLRIFGHLQSLDTGTLDRESSGRLLTVLHRDTHELRDFLEGSADSWVDRLLTSVAVSIAFFAIAPILGGISIAMVALLFGGLRFASRRLAPLYGKEALDAGKLMRVLTDELGGMAATKAFSVQEVGFKRVKQSADVSLESGLGSAAAATNAANLVQMTVQTGFVIALFEAGRLTMRGSIGIGGLTNVATLTPRVFSSLSGMDMELDAYHRARAAVNRIAATLSLRPRIAGGTRALPPALVEGRIDFDDVRFAYPGGPEVLHGVTASFAPNVTTALVGPTGSGKSTMVRLIIRLYEMSGGSISVDGVDVRGLDLADLRRAVGYAGQETHIVDGSVRENIVFGRRDAGEEEIVAAAKAAGAHDFISALPEGYDTEVGEKGVLLSAGQRQRIAVARVVLKDPAIFIFDEATSAVDPETEASLRAAIESIAANRTTIIVSHRLSSVRDAVLIHVVSDGRIVESGTHDALLSAKGAYAAMWKAQGAPAVPRPPRASAKRSKGGVKRSKRAKAPAPAALRTGGSSRRKGRRR